MRSLMLAALLFASTPQVLACSLDGAAAFEPTLETWERHPGPKQQDPAAEGAHWEPVPAPMVVVTRITRGTIGSGSDCGDAGTIELEFSLPSTSSYSIADFGVFFRVKKGTQPDEIFPDQPLVGQIEDGKMRFLLAWLDGAPVTHVPLDLEVEAFYVTNDLSIGAPTSFSVQAVK